MTFAQGNTEHASVALTWPLPSNRHALCFLKLAISHVYSTYCIAPFSQPFPLVPRQERDQAWSRIMGHMGLSLGWSWEEAEA